MQALLDGAKKARYDRQVVDRMLLATKDRPAKNWDEACGQYLLFRNAYSKDPRFNGVSGRGPQTASVSRREARPWPADSIQQSLGLRSGEIQRQNERTPRTFAPIARSCDALSNLLRCLLLSVCLTSFVAATLVLFRLLGRPARAGRLAAGRKLADAGPGAGRSIRGSLPGQ